MTTKDQQTISVALCTYNGAAYLPAQWQSLVDQTRLPDEVIVSDDCSTDGTVDLLHQLAAEAPFPVRISVNPKQLGFNKNFEKVLSLCSGDLIFICDQDDYWFPEKIGTMEAYINQHPDAQLAFCDAWVTDEDLKERQQRFWNWVRFDTEAQTRWSEGEMMEVMLDGNRVMGCATVIRRPFLDKVLPIPSEIPGYIYDGWIGLMGAAYNAIQFIDQPLQLYRTHVRQQVGIRQSKPGKRIRLRDRFLRQRALKLAPLQKKQSQLATINRLLTERVAPDAPGMELLRRRLSHFTMRSSLPTNRFNRVHPVLRSLREGNYNRYADAAANWYAPYLAVLGDILE